MELRNLVILQFELLRLELDSDKIKDYKFKLTGMIFNLSHVVKLFIELR